MNYRHPINAAGDKVWKLREGTMGDAIGMGINHAISVMVFAMASQARPVAVYATSQNPNVRGFEADPLYNILLKFDNGATGFCFGNIDNGNGYDAYHKIWDDYGIVMEKGKESQKGRAILVSFLKGGMKKIVENYQSLEK